MAATPSPYLRGLLLDLKRRLHAADLDDVSCFSGVSRERLATIRDAPKTHPNVHEVACIVDALEVVEQATVPLPPLRAASGKPKVSADEIERLGEPIFLLCDVYQEATRSSGIDLDLECCDAIIALLRGEPLEVAQAHISFGHQAAPLVRQALAELR